MNKAAKSMKHESTVMICDVCGCKIEWKNDTYGGLGLLGCIGWYRVTKITGRGSADLHVCSDECLRKLPDTKPPAINSPAEEPRAVQMARMYGREI